MNAATVIKGVMKFEGVTMKSLSERLGYAFYTGLQQRMDSKNDIRSSLLVKIADELGYEVVIRKRDKSQEFVIPVEDTRED